MLRNYGVVNGELYKPDDMNMAGGGDFGGGMEWPGELAEDFQTMTFDGETANAFGPDMASEDMASQDMPNIEETERPQGGRPAGGGFGGAEGTDSASATPPESGLGGTDTATTTPPDSGAGETVACGAGTANRFPGNMDNNMDINRQSMADWQNWCVYGGCLFLLLAALWMANKFVRRPYRQRRKNKTRDKG